MALNDFRKKKKEVGGTSRVQTADLGSQPLTRVGASGDGKNLITNRATQTGGAGDGVERGRSTIHFEQPTDTGTAGTLKRFRESAKGIPLDDPTLSNIQARKRAEKAPTTGSGKVLGPVGGATRPTGQIQRKSGAHFTDIGKFTKGGRTLRDRAGKELGLFGSAAELAKLFTSKEFQERKAKGIQAAAGAKGRRADIKAKTEKIKALSGVFKNLSETPGENVELMTKVQEQIQNLISGGSGDGPSGDTLGRLAEKFDTDQIKTILGIMR